MWQQGHCRSRMLIDKNVPNYLVKVKISSQRRRVEIEKKREEASFTFIAAKLFLERFVWEKESSNFPSRWSRLELALKDRTPASPHQFCLENKLSCGCRDIKHLAPRSEDGFLIAFAQLSKWFPSCDHKMLQAMIIYRMVIVEGRCDKLQLLISYIYDHWLTQKYSEFWLVRYNAGYCCYFLLPSYIYDHCTGLTW